MKRIIAFILMLVITLISLTSCDILAGAFLIWVGTQQATTPVAENEFFDSEYLEACLLSDMPVPDVEGSFRTEKTLYLNMTDEEFDTYSKLVFDYLWAKEDAYFKGYEVDSGLAGGIFFVGEDRYAPLLEDYNLENDAHRFIFSTTEFLNEGDEYNIHYWNYVVIRIVRSSGTLEKENFAYNTTIQITNDENNLRTSVYYEDYREDYNQ